MTKQVSISANDQRAVDIHTAQAAQFSERYEVKLAEPFKDCFAYSRYRLESFLRRYLPEEGKGKSVLDAGCGTGHQMMSLRQRGYEVAGVDASDGMLEFARANNPGARIEKAYVHELPFPDASFDYVISIEVLRYLEHPEPAIRELARVLKPGGVVLATAAPLFSLNAYPLVNQITSRLPVRNLTPLRQFFTTSVTLRRQFKSAGFENTSVHGVYLGPINWIERVARPVLPAFLRAWTKIDRILSDRLVLRECSNMYLVRAVRSAQA